VPIAVSDISDLQVPAVGINGFGRIGTSPCTLVGDYFSPPGRALFRLGLQRNDINLVAVNHTALSLEHLLTAIRHDSTHGACPLSREITIAPSDHPHLLQPTPNNPTPTGLLFRGRIIHLFSQRDASLLDWKSAGAEYIMESTGKMTTRDKANVHIKAGGARKVIISAPSKDVPNLVFGVNHGSYISEEDIISNASCTVSRSVSTYCSR
jgi:glyceraldehyde 3-phosphate dehydrogenase